MNLKYIFLTVLPSLIFPSGYSGTWTWRQVSLTEGGIRLLRSEEVRMKYGVEESKMKVWILSTKSDSMMEEAEGSLVRYEWL